MSDTRHRTGDLLTEALIDEFVQPAVDGLRTAAREGDRDALNAFAYELAMLAGTLVGTARRRRCETQTATVLAFDRAPRPDKATVTS